MSKEKSSCTLRFVRMCVVRTRVDAAMELLPAVICAFSLPAARGAVLQLIQLLGACGHSSRGVSGLFEAFLILLCL